MGNCDHSPQTFVKRHKKLGLLLGSATLAVSPALIMTSQASAQTPAAQPVGACTGPESASNFKCLEREVQAEFTFFEARFPVEAKLVKEEVAVEEQDAAAILSVIEADATR